MSVITAIEVCTVRVPLSRATSFSNRVVTGREFGLVRLRGAGRESGIGFAYVGTSGGELLALAVEKILAPVVLGSDSSEVERLWHDMYQEALLQGRSGVVMRAISALDIALWDLNARSAGLPLHQYLGASELESVPAYASGGYYLEGKTPARLGEEMAHYRALGFGAMKMKTGRLSPQAEEDRLRAVREAVGYDVDIMMDANNAWGCLAEALPYVRRFEKYQPHFLEEPFLADDIDSHAQLATMTTIPIATGEVEAGRWRHKSLLEKKAATILQTDAAVCGGITEWRRIAAMASLYGVPVYPHAFHDLHAPLVASSRNAVRVEMFLDNEVFNFSRLVDRPAEHRNGRILLRQSPGLGFDFDEAAVSEFALDKSPAGPWRQVR